MKINKKVTPALVEAACVRHRNGLDNPGFCIKCGHEAEGVEPDARGYECESCGEAAVYGAEELFLMMEGW